MNYIVFDIETQNTFAQVGGADATALDISLLALYNSKTDTYSSFLVDELDALWSIIESTDMLIGYNSDKFDIPLLNKYYMGDLTQIKSLDLLTEIRKSLGRRIKLDYVAQATLGTSKSGHGLDAVKWWRSGEIEKIRKYCLDDVRITKEVFDYALKHQSLKFKDGNEIRECSIDTSDWMNDTGGAVTQSLF